MPQQAFDEPTLRAAMAAYLKAAAALDEASQVGSDPRRLLDLAESKSVAAMHLRKQLEVLGWTAPAAQRSST